MNTKTKRVFISLVLGVTLLIGLLLAMGASRSPEVALAQGSTARYVAPAGNDSGNDCANSSTPCATIQHAVDVADPDDEILVATGIYTGVQARPRNDVVATGLVTQVVYMSKRVTIRGGYTITNWTAAYPITRPTTLDAQGQGRVLYITGDISPTIESLRITSGNAAGLGGDWQDAGGGVYVITATAIIKNNQIFSNTAFLGGGIYLSNSAATLNGNTVTANIADDVFASGGGIYLSNSAATLNGNTVTANIGYYGGGISLESSPAALNSNTIISNTAVGSSNGGGGLILARSDATLNGNTVISNTTSVDGGGLHLYESDAILNGNTIAYNRAGQGGGVYLNSSDATLNGNTIISNIASLGGGLWLGESAATLNGNTVAANAANSGGGGLWLDTSNITSTITLVNNWVVENQANTVGSGLYISAASILPFPARLLHTTIARNSGGDGSGIYITGFASVIMTNTILVSHTTGITVTADSTATLNGVLWYDNATNFVGTGTISITNEYTGDPVFLDPDAEDYHIWPDSTALDRGINTTVNHDIDGDPRPMGHGYDLGADELRISLVVTKQDQPDPVPAGASLTYTIRVTNTGDLTLTATITDTLPEHVMPTGSRTWQPDPITPGSFWTQQFTVAVEKDYIGVLTNVVQVTTDEGVLDIYTKTSEANPPPMLKITKQAAPDPVQAGARLTYTIHVTNTGNLTLTATITDILPDHVTPTGTLTWSDIAIAPAGVWTQPVMVAVRLDSCGWLTNRVQVTTAEGATGVYTQTSEVIGEPCIYLPIVLKEAS